MDKEIRKRVLEQVQACMRSMVGGSGHLAGYEVIPDTFKITKVEEIQVGLKRYIFEVKGYRESEFIIYDEHYQPVAEYIKGSIVLDKELKLAQGEVGEVILEP